MTRKITGLKQGEKYRLMKWIDDQREYVMATNDSETADRVGCELDLPKITKHHVAGARRSLGMMKPHVVPGAKADELAELRSEVVGMVAEWVAAYDTLSDELAMLRSAIELMDTAWLGWFDALADRVTKLENLLTKANG